MRAAPGGFSVARAVVGGFPALWRGRTLLAVVAIAFGIALGYAVQLINRAAVNELSAGLATLSGNADLQVRGPRAGFDEALYPTLARRGRRRRREPGHRDRRRRARPRANR